MNEDSRYISLTKNQVAIVDANDFEELSQFKWFALPGNKPEEFYAARMKPSDNSKFIFMHREILGVTNPEIYVDHENHNTLDNRRKNIRIATKSQNQYNRSKQANNTSGFKGVSFWQGKWHAQIGHKNQLIHIGAFNTPEEANEAYKAKAIELHKEFARF